jgi:hypothetical protein
VTTKNKVVINMTIIIKISSHNYDYSWGENKVVINMTIIKISSHNYDYSWGEVDFTPQYTIFNRQIHIQV